MSVFKKSRLSLIGVIAFGTAMLSACHSSNESSASSSDTLVECYGLSDEKEAPLLMTKTMCDKLPYTQEVLLSDQDYVQCYGVAAIGQNGCATKTNSCGGSSKIAKDPASWVALPRGVCAHLAGSSLEEPK